MRRLTTAVVTLGALAGLYANPADACTNPESGSGNPSVTGTPGSDSPSGSTTPGSGGVTETGTGTPGANTAGTGGSGGSTTPGSGGISEGSGGTATPNSGETLLDTSFVEVSWAPGNEVDGNPNNSAYWSHTGHRIATRVQVKDVTTQQVVMEETVMQYDYGTAVKGGRNPSIARLTAQLDPGRYEVRVQSVFSRHNEVRYGMDGRWVAASTPAPTIADSVPAARIIIPSGARSGGLVAAEGGCSTTGSALGGLWLLTLVLSARRKVS
jgi:hypothetical protein